MIKRASTSASWTALPSHAVAACLLLTIVSACRPPADKSDCVSVGMGWRACSGEMQANPSEGSSGDPAVAMTAPSPTKPGQNAGKGGGGALATGRASGGAGTGGAGAGGEVGAGSGGESDAGRAGASSTGAGLSTTAGSGAAPAAGADAPKAGSSAGGSGAGGARAGSSGDRGSAGRAGVSGESASAGRAAAGSGVASAGTSALPTTCCHSLGVCVASGSLRDEQRRLLVPDSCGGQDDVCAPTAVLAPQGYVPKTCRSVLQGEGRCLPDCMAGLVGQADKLPRDTCDTHELCAPCFDPITGSATGSCRLGADPGPRELPHVFRGCCLDGSGAPQGLCVPRGYIPTATAAPQGTCGADLFCVPRERIVDPTSKPIECAADIRGRGTCVPQCIAEALAPLVYVQATCPAGNACFPCQLVSGDSTGLCPAAP